MSLINEESIKESLKSKGVVLSDMETVELLAQTRRSHYGTMTYTLPYSENPDNPNYVRETYIDWFRINPGKHNESGEVLVSLSNIAAPRTELHTRKPLIQTNRVSQEHFAVRYLRLAAKNYFGCSIPIRVKPILWKNRSPSDWKESISNWTVGNPPNFFVFRDKNEADFMVTPCGPYLIFKPGHYETWKLLETIEQGDTKGVLQESVLASVIPEHIRGYGRVDWNAISLELIKEHFRGDESER